MRARKNVKDYSRIIAKETGMTEKQVRRILMFGWTNIIEMIHRGQEIRLTGFGRIYFEKNKQDEEEQQTDSKRDNLMDVLERAKPYRAPWLDE